MAKKKDEKKGIFCLEGEWRGVKDTTSVEPVLHLLQTMGGYKVPYVHHDVGTREEFDFYVKKWRGRSFASHPILYLGFHGERGCILVGEGRSNRPELMELADQLEGCCKGRVIHFGSCSTLDVNGHTLNGFLRRTGRSRYSDSRERSTGWHRPHSTRWCWGICRRCPLLRLACSDFRSDSGRMHQVC